MNDDLYLLRAWVEQGSEEDFARLVARYIDLVYSVAVRKVAGDTGLAAEIAQTVFADLARKAASLRAEGSLAGWLHRHTRYTAATALRGELRRRNREQTAAAMHALEHSSPDWSRLAPLLDDAVNALDESDRRAILLRFYERRDLQSVGAELGVSDDTAQKRVSRALEKLRVWLTRHGVTSSAAALATMLTAQSVGAAPVGMSTSIASGALAAAAAGGAGSGALTLLEIMTHAKAKLAMAAAAAAVVATPIVWQETAIARTRGENRDLAAQHVSPATVHAAPSPVASQAGAEDEAARERLELDRLRQESASLRAQIQTARENRLAAAANRRDTARRTPPPGLTAFREAQDVGNATPEALVQSLLWAMCNTNANRIMQLGAWPEDDGEAIRNMFDELVKSSVNGDFNRKTGDASFRAVRHVPLENGDAAVILEVGTGDSLERQALRVRRIGNEWRMVMGKDGPQDVKLSDDQLRD